MDRLKSGLQKRRTFKFSGNMASPKYPDFYHLGEQWIIQLFCENNFNLFWYLYWTNTIGKDVIKTVLRLWVFQSLWNLNFHLFRWIPDILALILDDTLPNQTRHLIHPRHIHRNRHLHRDRCLRNLFPRCARLNAQAVRYDHNGV